MIPTAPTTEHRVRSGKVGRLAVRVLAMSKPLVRMEAISSGPDACPSLMCMATSTNFYVITGSSHP